MKVQTFAGAINNHDKYGVRGNFRAEDGSILENFGVSNTAFEDGVPPLKTLVVVRISTSNSGKAKFAARAFTEDELEELAELPEEDLQGWLKTLEV